MLFIAALAVVAAVLAWRWLQQSAAPQASGTPPAPAVAPPPPVSGGENLSDEERRTLEGVLKRKGGAEK